MENGWRYLRRQVRVELVLKGTLTPRVLDVWEVAWTGGATGEWNSTQEGERDLFLVRVENGRYRLILDWSRNIFPVKSGTHLRAPLTDVAPLWERVALLTWWIEDDTLDANWYWSADPARALGWWRTAKLARGLMRHSNPAVRVAACTALVQMGRGQDECWEELTDSERARLPDMDVQVRVNRRRRRDRAAVTEWRNHPEQDERRLFTTVSDREKRAEFCRLYLAAYPGDADHGCPADRQPPATFVTAAGDVPLTALR